MKNKKLFLAFAFFVAFLEAFSGEALAKAEAKSTISAGEVNSIHTAKDKDTVRNILWGKTA